MNLSLTLPNPGPPALGSTNKAVLSFPPTWSTDPHKARASAVSPLAAIRPSAEPPRSGSTEPKPRLTSAPPSPTRDFRQILNDRVAEVSVAEAARHIKGGAPAEVDVVPRPPEGVKRMSRNRRNLHKNRKANRAAIKKPSPKAERAEAAAASMAAAPVAHPAAPSPAEIAEDVAAAEAVATTKAAKEAAARQRASVRSQMHGLSTQAVFHHAGSFGAAVPSCANAGSANPKTVLRFLTAKLAAKEFGGLIEVLLAWLPGGQGPGNRWLSVCSVALVAERDCRVLLAVAELHAPIDAVVGYFESTAVPGSKLKLSDVLDARVGQSGTSDLLGEPSSLWHFGETDSLPGSTGVDVDNTTVMLIPSSSFVRAGVLSDILARADMEHFDVAGLRLLFPTADQLADPSSVDFFLGRSQASVAFLAVALRAPRNTIRQWVDIVGPLDPLIAKKTDPGSIRALHGRDRDDRVLFCARGHEQANVQLAKWFGRRFDTSADCIVSDRGRKFLSTLPSETAVLFVERDAALQCFPGLVDLLTATGFTVSGVARYKIAPAEVSKLGATLKNADAKKKWDGVVWKVTKENAAHFAEVLLQDEHGALGRLGIATGQVDAAAYSLAVGVMFEKLEETPSNDLISRRMDRQAQALQNWGTSTPYAVVVSVFPAAVGGCAAWLRQLLTPPAGARLPLRMVASKWLSQVRSHQAKELTPFEVGDRGYRPSVAMLQGRSVQLLVLYGFDAFERTKAVLEAAYGDGADSQALVTPTALLAWRQLATFFFDRDVYLTPDMNGPALPGLDMSLRPLILNLTLTPRPIQTLAVLKAECTAQQVSKSLQAIKRSGLKIVRLKYTRLSDETATMLMASSPTQFPDPDGRAAYATGLTGSPLWTMALEHVNAVAGWQDLMGSPDPAVAKECPAFTLRGVFGGDRVQNKLFGSESYASAQGELDALFATISSGIYPTVGPGGNGGRFGLNEVPGQQRTTVLLRETACVVLTPLLLAKVTPSLPPSLPRPTCLLTHTHPSRTHPLAHSPTRSPPPCPPPALPGQLCRRARLYCRARFQRGGVHHGRDVPGDRGGLHGDGRARAAPPPHADAGQVDRDGARARQRRDVLDDAALPRAARAPLRGHALRFVHRLGVRGRAWAVLRAVTWQLLWLAPSPLGTS